VKRILEANGGQMLLHRVGCILREQHPGQMEYLDNLKQKGTKLRELFSHFTQLELISLHPGGLDLNGYAGVRIKPNVEFKNFEFCELRSSQ